MADTQVNNLGTFIVGAGTTVLSDSKGNLARSIIYGTYVGSVEFYDSRTTTGTAAGNLIGTIGLPLTNSYKNIDLDFPFKSGLTVVATGTPLVGVVWNK
jgi:hypothetical protein